MSYILKNAEEFPRQRKKGRAFQVEGMVSAKALRQEYVGGI